MSPVALIRVLLTFAGGQAALAWIALARNSDAVYVLFLGAVVAVSCAITCAVLRWEEVR